MPIGTETAKIFEENYKKAAVVLVCLSRAPACAGGGSAAKPPAAREDKKVVIPVYFEPELPAETFPAKLNFLKKLQGVTPGSVDGEAQLIGGLAQIAKARGIRPQKPAAAAAGPALRLVRIAIENLRCSSRLELEVSANTRLALLAGDNAAGKSTLLRAIALGLCRERESAALLKESSGRMIRRGATEATIALELELPGGTGKAKIVTRLLVGSAGEEIVRKGGFARAFPLGIAFRGRLRYRPRPAGGGRPRPLFGGRRGAVPLQRRRQPAESRAGAAAPGAGAARRPRAPAAADPDARPARIHANETQRRLVLCNGWDAVGRWPYLRPTQGPVW